MIVAAVIVMVTGWRLADPIVGAGIGLFIVPRTWSLLSQVTHILLEGTPPQVDVVLLERRLAEIPGVAGVHDLHVWTITSGLDAMSGTWWCLGRVTPPACCVTHGRSWRTSSRSITLRSRSKMRRFEPRKRLCTSERT